jgi:hypothetical protein
MPSLLEGPSQTGVGLMPNRAARETFSGSSLRVVERALFRASLPDCIDPQGSKC